MSRRRSRPQKDSGSQKGLKALVCVLAVICLIAGGVYIDTFYGGGKIKAVMAERSTKENPPVEKKKDPVKSMTVDISSNASMAVFGEEFLLCTKDGVKYFIAMGAQKWNDTFNMTSPVMVQEGDYIAVGDMGGKMVRVYNREGLLYELQAEGSPVQFAVNEKGYLSLITKHTNAYHIYIYNAKGNLLKERVEESRGVYPLCADISDDSRVFAVSYLDTTDLSPVGKICFFYIGQEDSETHTDSMFAGVEKTDEIIPVVQYRKGNVLAAVSDKAIYGIDSDGVEVWSYPLENTIDQAAFGNKEYIVLALGDSVANKDGRAKGTVCWLDGNGKERASYESGETVTYLYAGEKGVSLGNGREYTGLTHSGGESWNYTATSDLTDLMPMEKLNHAMLVAKEEVVIMEMKKAEETKTEEPNPEEVKQEQKDSAEEKAEETERTDVPEEQTEEKAETSEAEAVE